MSDRKNKKMSFRTVRNIGLMSLSLIVALVSISSFLILHNSSKKLETIITVEEARLHKWHDLLEVVSLAKNGTYDFYMGRSDSLEPVMQMTEKAFAGIDDIKKTTVDQDELAGIDNWTRELKVFRQAVYAYGYEMEKGYGGGASGKEMENAALSSADEMIKINREIDEKISSRITENNKSILRTISVSRKITGIISIVFVSCAALVGFLMNKALAGPIDKLVQATRRVADGDLTNEIKVESDDEIGELSNSFNEMVRNLREQKNKLVEQRDYVDSIIEGMAESLIVLNYDGTIRTVNRAACELLGYQENELSGRDVNILFPKKNEDGESDDDIRMNGHIHDWGHRNHLTAVKAKDGKSIPVLFSSSVLKDKDGNIRGVICVAQDISELEKAEKKLKSYTIKLKESNTELRQFLHIAAHDLHEPLRKIAVFGDRLKNKYIDIIDQQGRDYIERMQRGTARMQALLSDLLVFSGITARAIAFKVVDLSAIAGAALDDLETYIEQTRGRVEIGALPVIEADPFQMRQLLQNLIGNALKFSKKNEAPFVKVHGVFSDGNGSASGNEYYQLIIEDNGIGFDEQYSERIFGVFQRLHGRSEYEGSGIGLSVCKKIVERHGGSITAKGKPGHGAKFIVTLPVKQT